MKKLKYWILFLNNVRKVVRTHIKPHVFLYNFSVIDTAEKLVNKNKNKKGGI